MYIPSPLGGFQTTGKENCRRNFEVDLGELYPPTNYTRILQGSLRRGRPNQLWNTARKLFDEDERANAITNQERKENVNKSDMVP